MPWYRRHIALIIAALLGAVLLLGLAIVLPRSTVLPIRLVQVQGDFSVHEQPELEHVITPFARQGFFAVRLAALQSQLQSLPWTASVVVRRVWPNKILVDIYSQQAAGFWNQSKLVNMYGEIFDIQPVEVNQKQLPSFFGPTDATVKVLDYYQRMSDILTILGVAVVELRYDNGDTWEIALDNGMKMQLGDEDVLTKLRRFVRVYPTLIKGHKKPPVSVDLRYPDGLAIRW